MWEQTGSGQTEGGTHLVSSVVTGHVTLPAVNAHLWIDQSLHLLLNVELLIGADVFQSFGYHILSVKTQHMATSDQRSKVLRRKVDSEL